MKKFLKKILERKLKNDAKRILAKYKPDIIGITGSVGKTSAKVAVYTVLKDFFTVRKSEKNYNNEIGVPLTIIGKESAKKSLLGWFKVFWHAKKLIYFQMPYPKILILEMAADRPGDIEYLTSFIQCRIGILTSIGHAHLEQFRTQENIIREKRKLLERLDKKGIALLNADDSNVLNLKKYTKARVVTFGFSQEADLRAAELKLIDEQHYGLGIHFKLLNGKSVIPVFLPGCLGEQFALCALAGALAGELYGLTLLQAANSLKNFRPPKGRMRYILGIKNTRIIDDTYNSSPESLLAAFKAVAQIPAKRKIAVLGDMLELGRASSELHYDAGKRIQDFGIDYLYVSGERARDIARGAKESGFLEDRVFEFSNSSEAGKFLQNRLEPGDLILVKGSQGARMESAVKEIMAEPRQAHEILVRQEIEWQ